MSFSQRTDILIDAGQLWEVNSNAHPLNIAPVYDAESPSTDLGAFHWLHEYLDEYSSIVQKARDLSDGSLSILFLPGMAVREQNGADRQYHDPAYEPFLWSEAFLNKRWYAKLLVRATNEASSLKHYSGVPRSKSRFGVNTGEIDQSALGYNRGPVKVEFGRGREIWGPLAEDNLALSGDVPSWERLSVQLRHRRFTFRYFFGSLRTEYARFRPGQEKENILRYMTGRAIEYRNFKNLVIGLGEVSTFAGVNRPVDFAMLNPLALHLEVEQNDRENDQSHNSSKFLWFIDIDWLVLSSLRITGSILLDEFQIDREDYRKGIDDALGFMGRIAWTPLRRNTGVTLFATGVRIDTYTYMHNCPFTNSVNAGQLIGHPLGNDAEDYSVGVRLVFRHPVLLEAVYGKRCWGDYSLHIDPETVYPPGFSRQPSFPSGQVRTNRYLKTRIDSQIYKNLYIGLDGWLDINHSEPPDSEMERWTITARYILPISFAGI